MEQTNTGPYNHKTLLIDAFLQEGRHLRIPHKKGKLVIVGDLHGDGRTLHSLLNKFLFNSAKFFLVYLADYVDREPSSWNTRPSAVIDLLLSLKIRYPDRVYLLMGNHDLDPSRYVSFYSRFWSTLSPEQSDFYSDVLSALPVVATTSNGVAMCHAALPTTRNFKSFSLHDKKWIDTIWADYYEDGDDTSRAYRPVRQRKDFERSMKAFGCSLLLRGHDPNARLLMYDNRCVTIQSNRFYREICGMKVVVIDLQKEGINDANDVEIVDISDID